MAENVDTLDSGDDSAPVDDRASDIAEAFEQVETRDTPPAPAGNSGAPAAPAGLSGERARGPDGRFASEPAGKPPEKAAGAPDSTARPRTVAPPLPAAGKPPAPAAAAPAPGADPAALPVARAPASWKPGAREHWGKLPAEVQAEVVRRETEIGRTLQESSRAREALSHVQEVVGPYAQNIAASGSDVIGAIGNFFKADNTLRHGSISDKASLVADIIKNYGVDIVALDSVLAGQQVAPDPNEAMATKLRQEMQAQLQPVMSYFNQMQGRRQEAFGAIRENAGSEVQQFAADGAHEFFDDVRVDMADIIDLYTARNQQISLQDAYDRAIMINPQVREIVSRRAEAEKVNAQAQAAQRARRAAASINGSPAPAGSPGPASGADRRAEIEAAWDANTAG